MLLALSEHTVTVYVLDTTDIVLVCEPERRIASQLDGAKLAVVSNLNAELS